MHVVLSKLSKPGIISRVGRESVDVFNVELGSKRFVFIQKKANSSANIKILSYLVNFAPSEVLPALLKIKYGDPRDVSMRQ